MTGHPILVLRYVRINRIKKTVREATSRMNRRVRKSENNGSERMLNGGCGQREMKDKSNACSAKKSMWVSLL